MGRWEEAVVRATRRSARACRTRRASRRRRACAVGPARRAACAGRDGLRARSEPAARRSPRPRVDRAPRSTSQPNAIGSRRSGADAHPPNATGIAPGMRAAARSTRKIGGGKLSKASHEVSTRRPIRSGLRVTTIWESAPPVSLPTSVTSSSSSASIASAIRSASAGGLRSAPAGIGLEVRAERQVERHACAAAQQRHDLAPQVRVHERAVDEHDGRALARHRDPSVAGRAGDLGHDVSADAPAPAEVERACRPERLRSPARPLRRHGISTIFPSFPPAAKRS